MGHENSAIFGSK